MELKKYREEINELRKYYAHENLNSLILKKIPTAKNNSLFNIRMEIKRMANVCSKTIDLRYILTDQACIPYTFQNITHYLDETAINYFNKELKIYDNMYTEGIHDLVLADAKSRLEEEKKKKLLKVINFTQLNKRNEERMNFTVMLKLFILSEQSPFGFKEFMNDSSKSSYDNHPCVSINISKNGLKIKTKKSVRLTEDEVIFVEFEKEKLRYNEKSYFIPYQIAKIEEEEDFIYFSMRKVNAFDNNDFNDQLSIFIREHKDKYKVELNNIMESAKIKSLEQAYMENLQKLPLYFDGKKLKYAFTSGKNEDIAGYFENEYGENVLSNIFNYLNFSMPENDNTQSIYFMTFKMEKHDKTFFFARTITQEIDEMLKLFSLYGARRNNFRIFKLDLINIDKEEYILNNPLPNDILEKNNFSNYLITDSAKLKLDCIQTIALLSDVTDSDYKFNLSNLDMNVENSRFNELRQCIVDTKKINEFEIIEDESTEIRRDDRFSIKEIIKFKHKKISYKGETNNVSMGGLQVLTDRYVPILEGEKLIVTFTNLENNGLIDIPYRVVKATNQLLSLKLLKEDNYEAAFDYFSNYIRRNINSLKVVGMKNKVIGLSKGLRNIYINNHLEAPCLFKENDNEIKEYYIGNSKQTNKVFSLLSAQNVEKVLHSETFKQKVMEVYNIIPHNKFHTFKFFVQLINGKKNYLITKIENDFSSEKDKLEFLKMSINGQAFCFKVSLIKTEDNFSDKYYRDEVEYIEKYSEIKAAQIKKEVRQVSGILNIQNITDIKIRQLELLK